MLELPYIITKIQGQKLSLTAFILFVLCLLQLKSYKSERLRISLQFR